MAITWKDIAYMVERKIPREWRDAACELCSTGCLGPRITISRAISIPDEGHIQWNNIGACWSEAAEFAKAYCDYNAPSGSVLYRISGTVNADDVNWEATLSLRAEYSHEREIRLRRGAVVSVFLIERWDRYARDYRGDELAQHRVARVALDDDGDWCSMPQDED